MPSSKTTQRKSSRRELTEEDLGIRDVAKINRPRSFVLYGRSGTGKTTLLSTFPKPILLLDFKDQGTDSVSDVKDLRVKYVEETEEVEDIYWFLKKNPDRYATVGFDTMSAWQQIIINEIVAAAKGDRKHAGDWGSMTKRDWGDAAQELKYWIMNFRDLDMNVVFVAQDRTFNVEEEDTEGQLDPEVGPRLMPSVASALNASVSVIGNTFTRTRYVEKEVRGKKKEVRRTEYCLRLGPNPVYITKVRKPRGIVAPDFIVDPVYEDIIEVIEGENHGKESSRKPRR